MNPESEKIENNAQYLCQNIGIGDISTMNDFPLYLAVEVTSKCNSSCRMCPRSFMEIIHGDLIMEEALREKIIVECRERNAFLRRVTVNGHGEPLMDPGLPRFISRLKKAGVKEVFFSTNASLLNDEKTPEILASGVDQIDVSIDAFSKKLYEELRRGLDRDVVYNNVSNFLNARKSGGFKTKIRFRYILQGINDSEFEPFSKFWKTRLSSGDIISRKIQHTFGGTMAKSGESEKLQKIAALPCKGIFSTMAIYANGNVSLCNYDMELRHTLGNVNDNKIAEIWKNPKLHALRLGHLEKGRFAWEECLKCDSWQPELKLPDITIQSAENDFYQIDRT